MLCNVVFERRLEMKVISVIFTIAFLILQFAIKTQYTSGPVCSPTLTQTGIGSHPRYEVVGYGFPRPILSIVTDTCFESQTTKVQIEPIGLILSIVILTALTYPLWRRKA